MTLIASWVATDDKPTGKKISAVYFCADSRFSWTPTGKVYDMGKKVFTCKCFPEIFCFCGDVEFPTNTINSLIAEIENGVLFAADANAQTKKALIADYISRALEHYPKDVLAQSFHIYHATCIRQEFYITKYSYEGQGIQVYDLPLPAVSTLVFSAGSGKSLFEKNWRAANQSSVNEKYTSRNVYNCFSTTVDEAGLHPKNRNLSMVGGSPQMVGLYRTGKTQLFGIVKNGMRYIHGHKVDYNPSLNNIEWRNDNFECVDPQTMELRAGAKPQPFAPRGK